MDRGRGMNGSWATSFCSFKRNQTGFKALKTPFPLLELRKQQSSFFSDLLLRLIEGAYIKTHCFKLVVWYAIKIEGKASLNGKSSQISHSVRVLSSHNNIWRALLLDTQCGNMNVFWILKWEANRSVKEHYSSSFQGILDMWAEIIFLGGGYLSLFWAKELLKNQNFQAFRDWTLSMPSIVASLNMKSCILKVETEKWMKVEYGFPPHF
jgi:hypothetical protein